MAVPAPSIYFPLQKDCIRLLRVENRELLRLKLVGNVFYLTKPTKYTALSYCWGDPNNHVIVQINDQPVRITTSLRDALASIAAQTGSHVCSWLWADALCINQQDLIEKEEQVQKMWRVYQDAETVFSWLGEEDATTPGFMERVLILRNALKQGLVSQNKNGHWRTSGGADESDDQLQTFRRLEPGAVEPPCEVTESAGNRLISRRYFSRVWMITECTQAKILVFGIGTRHFFWEELSLYQAVNPCGSASPLEAR